MRMINAEYFTKHIEEHFGVVIDGDVSSYTIEVDFSNKGIVELRVVKALTRKKCIKSDDIK